MLVEELKKEMFEPFSLKAGNDSFEWMLNNSFLVCPAKKMQNFEYIKLAEMNLQYVVFAFDILKFLNVYCAR